MCVIRLLGLHERARGGARLIVSEYASKVQPDCGEDEAGSLDPRHYGRTKSTSRGRRAKKLVCDCPPYAEGSRAAFARYLAEGGVSRGSDLHRPRRAAGLFAWCRRRGEA